jgi:LysM repeat protein
MYDIYTVKNNETLSSISNKLGITMKMLSSINNNIIEVTTGMTLLIPKKNNEYFDYYTINKGDTLYNIAKKYNINSNMLAILNGLDNDDYIYTKQVIMVPKNNVKVYITADGDTVQNIIKGINADIYKFLEQNKNLYLLSEQLIIYKDN